MKLREIAFCNCESRSLVRPATWTHSNPVKTVFGAGFFNELPQMNGGHAYTLVTYSGAPFQDIVHRLSERPARRCWSPTISRLNLYPETAVINSELMVKKRYGLTLETGLDTLSHAMESIWNINANLISARHAVAAARTVLDTLPALPNDLDNQDLHT